MPQMPITARRWQVCQNPTETHSGTHAGKPAPRKWFHRIEDARAAAKDLTQRTGRSFVVLETVEIFRARDEN